MRGSQETHLSPKVDSYLPPPPYFTDGDFPQQGKALAQVSQPAWQVTSGAAGFGVGQT